jgi:hypothetical protein
MDKVRSPLPWAVSACEPTLVVVQVSKAFTWLLIRGGAGAGRPRPRRDDRGGLIGAAAA